MDGAVATESQCMDFRSGESHRAATTPTLRQECRKFSTEPVTSFNFRRSFDTTKDSPGPNF